MKQTQFFSAQNLAEVLTLLNKYWEKAVIVNGGTDIVEKISRGEKDPEAIIYIRNIEELKKIRETDSYVVIGGATTYNEVLASPLCKQFSGLIQAVSEIGSPPIRVVGTPAGNIGTAVPAADCNVALLALNAEIVLASEKEERTVSAANMFVGYCKTELNPNELIKEIRLPKVNAGNGSAFLKLSRRKAQDIAQVSVCVHLSVEGEVCRTIRIALGAVSATAVRAYSLEKLLLDKNINEGIRAIKEAFPTEANLRNPRNKAYKEAVIGVLVERAIILAYNEVLGGKDIG